MDTLSLRRLALHVLDWRHEADRLAYSVCALRTQCTQNGDASSSSKSEKQSTVKASCEQLPMMVCDVLDSQRSSVMWVERVLRWKRSLLAITSKGKNEMLPADEHAHKYKQRVHIDAALQSLENLRESMGKTISMCEEAHSQMRGSRSSLNASASTLMAHLKLAESVQRSLTALQWYSGAARFVTQMILVELEDDSEPSGFNRRQAKQSITNPEKPPKPDLSPRTPVTTTPTSTTTLESGKDVASKSPRSAKSPVSRRKNSPTKKPWSYIRHAADSALKHLRSRSGTPRSARNGSTPSNEPFEEDEIEINVPPPLPAQGRRDNSPFADHPNAPDTYDEPLTGSSGRQSCGELRSVTAKTGLQAKSGYIVSPQTPLATPSAAAAVDSTLPSPAVMTEYDVAVLPVSMTSSFDGRAVHQKPDYMNSNNESGTHYNSHASAPGGKATGTLSDHVLAALPDLTKYRIVHTDPNGPRPLDHTGKASSTRNGLLSSTASRNGVGITPSLASFMMAPLSPMTADSPSSSVSASTVPSNSTFGYHRGCPSVSKRPVPIYKRGPLPANLREGCDERTSLFFMSSTLNAESTLPANGPVAQANERGTQQMHVQLGVPDKSMEDLLMEDSVLGRAVRLMYNMPYEYSHPKSPGSNAVSPSGSSTRLGIEPPAPTASGADAPSGGAAATTATATGAAQQSASSQRDGADSGKNRTGSKAAAATPSGKSAQKSDAQLTRISASEEESERSKSALLRIPDRILTPRSVPHQSPVNPIVEKPAAEPSNEMARKSAKHPASRPSARMKDKKATAPTTTVWNQDGEAVLPNDQSKGEEQVSPLSGSNPPSPSSMAPVPTPSHATKLDKPSPSGKLRSSEVSAATKETRALQSPRHSPDGAHKGASPLSSTVVSNESGVASNSRSSIKAADVAVIHASGKDATTSLPQSAAPSTGVSRGNPPAKTGPAASRPRGNTPAQRKVPALQLRLLRDVKAEVSPIRSTGPKSTKAPRKAPAEANGGAGVAAPQAAGAVGRSASSASKASAVQSTDPQPVSLSEQARLARGRTLSPASAGMRQQQRTGTPKRVPFHVRLYPYSLSHSPKKTPTHPISENQERVGSRSPVQEKRSTSITTPRGSLWSPLLSPRRRRYTNSVPATRNYTPAMGVDGRMRRNSSAGPSRRNSPMTRPVSRRSRSIGARDVSPHQHALVRQSLDAKSNRATPTRTRISSRSKSPLRRKLSPVRVTPNRRRASSIGVSRHEILPMRAQRRRTSENVDPKKQEEGNHQQRELDRRLSVANPGTGVNVNSPRTTGVITKGPPRRSGTMPASKSGVPRASRTEAPFVRPLSSLSDPHASELPNKSFPSSSNKEILRPNSEENSLLSTDGQPVSALAAVMAARAAAQKTNAWTFAHSDGTDGSNPNVRLFQIPGGSMSQSLQSLSQTNSPPPPLNNEESNCVNQRRANARRSSIAPSKPAGGMLSPDKPRLQTPTATRTNSPGKLRVVAASNSAKGAMPSPTQTSARRSEVPKEESAGRGHDDGRPRICSTSTLTSQSALSGHPTDLLTLPKSFTQPNAAPEERFAGTSRVTRLSLLPPSERLNGKKASPAPPLAPPPAAHSTLPSTRKTEQRTPLVKRKYSNKAESTAIEVAGENDQSHGSANSPTSTQNRDHFTDSAMMTFLSEPTPSELGVERQIGQYTPRGLRPADIEDTYDDDSTASPPAFSRDIDVPIDAVYHSRRESPARDTGRKPSYTPQPKIATQNTRSGVKSNVVSNALRVMALQISNKSSAANSPTERSS